MILFSSVIYAQDFTSRYKFNNYNEIKKIIFTQNSSSFLTPYGALKKDYKRNEWTIDTTKKSIDRIRYYENDSTRLPSFLFKQYEYFQGQYVCDSIVNKNNRVYLTESYGDLSEHYFINDINYNHFSALDFTAYKIFLKDNFIYFLGDYGFIKMKRGTDDYEQYVILPLLKLNTEYLIEEDGIWFLNDIGVQRINDKTGLIDYWNFKTLANSSFSYNNYSNIIQHNNSISFIADNVLFTYSKLNKKWITKELPNIFYAHILYEKNNLLFIGSNYVDDFEGSYDPHGGLALYNQLNSEFTKYKEIDTTEMVIDISSVGNEIIVKTIQRIDYELSKRTFTVSGIVHEYYIALNNNNKIRSGRTYGLRPEEYRKIYESSINRFLLFTNYCDDYVSKYSFLNNTYIVPRLIKLDEK